MSQTARLTLVLLILVSISAVLAPTAGAQIQIFSTGQYGTPETISLAPPGFGTFENFYFIPDFRLSNIWTVPITGGPPTAFLAEPLGDPGSIQSGLFLPSGWGASSGKFLVASNVLKVLAADGTVTQLDPSQPESGFTLPLIAPANFGTFGGNLFVSDQSGAIWRMDPAGGGLTVFKDLSANPAGNEPFGMEFTPSAFGAFSNRLLASHGSSNTIVAVAADGTDCPFATVLLAEGQVGLRQMLLTPPDYFLGTRGISGRILLLSITGSRFGGGTLGAVVGLDSTGAVVVHLKEGGVLSKFDPRGMVLHNDGNILISDTSDPILLATPADFIAGPAARTLSALSPARLWIGLRNSDDQGTQFDLKVELLRNGTPIASGLTRCLTGVTRNPALAKEAVTPFDPFDPVIVTAGDVLSLRASTRIGTNPNGTKCAGPGGSHASAVGLRLYYDSTNRSSRFDATITPGASGDLFLRSDGGPCPAGDGQSPGVTSRTLDPAAPSAGSAKCKDSGIVSFAGGNAFSTIGTWSLPALP